MHAASSPLHSSLLPGTASGNVSSLSAQDVDNADVTMAAVLESLKTSRRVLQSQIDEVYELKVVLLSTSLCLFLLPVFSFECLLMSTISSVCTLVSQIFSMH